MVNAFPSTFLLLVLQRKGTVSQLMFQIPHGLVNLASGFECSVNGAGGQFDGLFCSETSSVSQQGKTLSHGDASFSSDVWTGLITWSASHTCKEGGQNPRGCHSS